MQLDYKKEILQKPYRFPLEETNNDFENLTFRKKMEYIEKQEIDDRFIERYFMSLLDLSVTLFGLGYEIGGELYELISDFAEREKSDIYIDILIKNENENK